MAENCRETGRCRPDGLQDALSIHTRKITDSCRDKDCIEDLRVYMTTNSQALLDKAAGAKVRSAELLYAYIDVEPVAFDRNHYCIDVTFYYRVLADATIGTCVKTCSPARTVSVPIFCPLLTVAASSSSKEICTLTVFFCTIYSNK